MHAKCLGGLWSSWIVSAIFLSVVSGCAGIPSTYRMSPEETRAFRSGLGTIGVSVSEHRADLEFAGPAKGRFGGLKRGFVSGAAKPILIGLEDTVQCVGEQRKYLEWGENNGQLFYDSALACLPRLREKVIDDLFLVYPLATP